MPVPMNPTAEIARKTARRKNARRAMMIGAGCLALGFAFGWLLARRGGLPLPERFVPVYVITSTGRAKVAYTDENNTFRSVETGEPVYQVTNWTRP